MLDEVFPILQEVPSREPAVLMSILGNVLHLTSSILYNMNDKWYVLDEVFPIPQEVPF